MLHFTRFSIVILVVFIQIFVTNASENKTIKGIQCVIERMNCLVNGFIYDNDNQSVNAENVKNIMLFEEGIQSGRNISRIIITSVELPLLPDRFCSVFSDMTELIIKNTSLSRIQSGALNDCKNLKLLDLAENRLIQFKIPQENLSNLITLNLSSNNLLDLDIHRTLRSFPSLKTIELSNNWFHCTRVEILKEELKAKRITFTTTSRKIQCFNSTEWIQNVENYFDNNREQQTEVKLITLLIKSLLHIIEGTEDRINKIIDINKRDLMSYKITTEKELTNLETDYAQYKLRQEKDLLKLQYRFDSYAQRTDEELKTLHRLLTFCFVMLLAFVIVLTANIARTSCHKGQAKSTKTNHNLTHSGVSEESTFITTLMNNR